MRSPRVLLTSLVWLVLAGLTACGDNGARDAKSLTVAASKPQLPVGTTVDVVATYTLGNHSSVAATDVTWSVADATIATITPGAEGHAALKGIKVGSTTVTAEGSGLTGTVTITVTAAALVSIGITPSAPSLAAGTSVKLTATGVYTDATTLDLSSSVAWSSATTTVATVDATGLLHGVKAGTAKITAAQGSVKTTVTATVTSATLTSIEVAPLDPSLAVGITQQLTATGVFSDGSKQDLMAGVTWSSSDPVIATVSPAGLVTALAVGTATMTATMGAISGTTHVMVTPAVLVSIAIDPPNPSVALGRTQQLTATGTFTDHTTQDLTTQVTWASGTETVAMISATGLVSTVTTGTSVITATLGSITGTTTLTVRAADLVSIAVTPSTPSLPLGRTLQFTAIGTFSDSTIQDLTTQVAWASSNETVAQISNAAASQGVATALAVGQTTIIATLSGITGQATLTATDAVLEAIDVTPTTPSLAIGLALQFTATGRFSDHTTHDLTADVTWASSVPLFATISNAAGTAGKATAVAVGDTTISATSGTITGSTTLTVTPAILVSIQVTPETPSIAAGTTQQFTATGVFSDSTTQDLTAQVTWASSDTTVATISNAAGTNGLATSVHTGSTTISATFPGATPVVGSTTLTVTPAVLASIQVTPSLPSLSAGTTVQFTATGVFSDATTQNLTTQVTWASSDPTVATISNADPTQGLATGLVPGTTTISATLSGITGQTTLTVTDAVLTSIQVTPVNPSLAKGLSLGFVATGVFSDASTQNLTTQVAWSSSDPTIAAISNAAGSQGQATALAEGTTTISAAFGAVTGQATLTVTPAVVTSIAVTPSTPSVAAGLTQQFTATATLSDTTTQDVTTQVTWASSAAAVATISNAAGSQGLATGIAVGTTTISATFQGVTGSTTLTVTTALLASIAVTPADTSVAKGRTQQFTAIGTFTDASVQDLTTQVTWASSADTVAQISNAAGTQGLATAVDTGTATISATLNGVTGSTGLTVTAAVLVSIAVTPATASLAPGGTKQYAAIGTFSDGSIQDLTTQVAWTSSDPTVAAISSAAGSNGLATAIAAGATTITASLVGVTGSATLTVTATLACDPLTNPANGAVSVSNGGIFPSTAAYTCNGGFAPLGSAFRTCQADGTWSGSAPTCNAASVMVVRVGDGAAALSGSSTAVFVEKRNVADGSVLQTIPLPTTGTPFTISGNATSEGGLSRSVDGRFVTLAGYAATTGVATIANTANLPTGTATNRAVARIDAIGTADASTLLLNAFSGTVSNAGNVRAATTIDGSSFWVSGTSSGGATGGVHFVQFGSTGTTTRVLSTPDNSRWAHVFNGQLYGSSASGTAAGVFTVGTGTPTTTGATATLFASIPSAVSAYGFVLLDRSPTIAGVDTLYVAFDSAAAANTLNVQKWMFSGTAWTQDTAFKPAVSGTGLGARGLAAWVDAAGVHVIATTSEGTLNHIVSFLDDGSTETPAVTTLAAAVTNTIFRGVALSPVP